MIGFVSTLRLAWSEAVSYMVGVLRSGLHRLFPPYKSEITPFTGSTQEDIDRWYAAEMHRINEKYRLRAIRFTRKWSTIGVIWCVGFMLMSVWSMAARMHYIHKGPNVWTMINIVLLVVLTIWHAYQLNTTSDETGDQEGQVRIP